jgi:hypothetical protein
MDQVPSLEWPYDSRSDQVHQEKTRERERLQADITEAWLTVCAQLPLEMAPELVSAVRLVEWRLGI